MTGQSLLPRRIISLVPSLTESLFDLGAGERVVGITDYCIHPAGQLESIPRLGGTKSPDVGRTIELEPDLVIANREENRKEDVEALEAAGLSVWVTYPRTVRETVGMLWELLDRLHLLDRGPSIRGIEGVLDWVEGAASGVRPVRVFCPIWHEPWMTISHNTYTHDLLRICGGMNVFAEWPGTRYPSVTLDDVVEMAPEVILLPDDPYQFDENHRDELRALDIPAARDDRILLVDGSYLTWFGTRLGRALQVVPEWLRTPRS